MRAVFLDRDGTTNVGTPVHERVDSVDKMRLFPDTLEALRLLSTLDFKVFLITNQSGIAEGLMTAEQAGVINQKLLELVKPSGVEIVQTYVCPHQESDHCACRKPLPKMLLDAARDHGIDDLAHSWMVGDRATDVETGVNAGTQTILVMSGRKDAQSDKANYVAANLLDAIRHIAEQEKKTQP
jgi:histidinol-phosphate phosphatase family protein